VQEASSMFVYHVLKQVVKNKVLMLDLCAAPGGKTTCAMSALPQGSKMFSNEPIRQRSQILNENIQKFGVQDICVTNNYAKDYQKSKLMFDVILTDVPCSGEGMFRKDEGAINEWSTKNVNDCQKLQREIVSDIWDCLKPGGILIYSTCTFNAHEDEENVAWIADNLGADFINIETKAEWNITGSLIDKNPVYRFIPGKTRGEGIFMAVLQKHGEYDGKMSMSNIDAKALKPLHVLYNGVEPDTIKGKQAIPHHSKAMSTYLVENEYAKVEIDYNQAIAYLRKEAITLNSEAPKGIVLLTYQKHPIGFAKNIGNRANNLYPQEWKIKSSHIPQEDTTIIE
jgi:NOL1/NOP2/fmu family ribosome biogenesis protein